MKKYWDTVNDRVITEDELRLDYESLKRNGELDPEIYSTFEYYLNGCLASNNGNLEPCADDVWVKRLRKDVASDLACDEMPYNDVLEVLNKANAFENWILYEINNRPVDLHSTAEWVAQELGL